MGLLLACCLVGDKKWLYKFTKIYVSLFRGTPLLVQLSVFYFVVPQMTGLDISGFVAGIIAFSFNCAAYVAEIIRGGIQSVDGGQYLAADTLGIDHCHKMKDIILP